MLLTIPTRRKPSREPSWQNKSVGGGPSLASLLVALSVNAVAQEDLFDLSLDQLLNIEITTVSKRGESIEAAAAAVFVITEDDIRRSGARSIPEALRLAPGIEAAQIDGTKWAISARGYNLRFSNKLLVLIDGRAVYSPVFSGVFWDVQDTMLEDIERIEVVRGPGAALWGANAVNGVINVITKSAYQTQGGLLSAGAGNQERGFVSARWGGRVGENTAYRAYVKHFDRAENHIEGPAPSGDAWDQSRLGFRIDTELSQGSSLFLSGELFSGDSAETGTQFAFEPPFARLQNREQPVDGHHLVLRWDVSPTATEDASVQIFRDVVDRDGGLFNIERKTNDVYVQLNSSRLRRQDIVIGGGYRITDDVIDRGVADRAFADPRRLDEETINLFFHDEIAVVPDRFFLTLGSKFEYNDFTGWEVQPGVRARYALSERASLWTSASRAVRTPGRADRDYRLLYDVVPPAGPGLPPVAFNAAGSKAAEGEDLDSFELGFKFRASESLYLDVATYYNRYDNLRSARLTPPLCLPSLAQLPACLADPATVAITTTAAHTNEASSETRGLEASIDWRPKEGVRLQSSYTYFKGNEDSPGVGLIESDTLVTSPKHQGSLRLGYMPHNAVELDLWLRYVDEITAFNGTRIDAYATADARLAWRPTKNVEIALVGKNLFNKDQAQFLSEPVDVPLTGIRRSVFLQVNFGN